MKSIAFFNNKGGVGKTTLAYHTAWMAVELGKRVLAVDLDPQANLTSMFVEEQRLRQLWPEDGLNSSIYRSIFPILDGTGDIDPAHIEMLEAVDESLGLIPGDLGLSEFEDKLSDSWPRCLDRDKAAFRATTAFARIMSEAAKRMNADLILVDVGPNLGAINRAAMIASDYLVLPLAPSLFSLQGLRNLGPTLKKWRDGWADRLARAPEHLDIELPKGLMEPLGYVVQQHSERKNRPVKAYDQWALKIPGEYSRAILDRSGTQVEAAEDPACLGMVKNYLSLMALAEDARKPVFHLKPADGAIGAHSEAARRAYTHFKHLTKKILDAADL